MLKIGANQVDKLVTHNDVQQQDGFIRETLRWCMSSRELDQYQKDLKSYCKNKKGDMIQGHFCADISGQPLFMAKVSELDNCHPAIQNVFVETVIIESTQSVPTESYLKTLASQGFKSRADIAAADEKYQEMDMASWRQHEIDLPIIVHRGTSVCTKQRGTIIYGWVEDYAEPNLKLRIYGWGSIGSPNIIRYPREQIIWAPHTNWNLCY